MSHKIQKRRDGFFGHTTDGEQQPYKNNIYKGKTKWQ